MATLTITDQWEDASNPGVAITTANVGDQVCIVFYAELDPSGTDDDWEFTTFGGSPENFVPPFAYTYDGWFTTGHDASSMEASPFPSGSWASVAPDGSGSAYVGFVYTVTFATVATIDDKSTFFFRTLGVASTPHDGSGATLTPSGWGSFGLLASIFRGPDPSSVMLGEYAVVGAGAGGVSDSIEVEATTWTPDLLYPLAFLGLSGAGVATDSSNPIFTDWAFSGLGSTYDFGSLTFPPDVGVVYIGFSSNTAGSKTVGLTFTSGSHPTEVVSRTISFDNERFPVGVGESFIFYDAGFSSISTVAVDDPIYVVCDYRGMTEHLTAGVVVIPEGFTVLGAEYTDMDGWTWNNWTGFSGAGSSHDFGDGWSTMDTPVQVRLYGKFTSSGTGTFVFSGEGTTLRKVQIAQSIEVTGTPSGSPSLYPTVVSQWYEADGVTPISEASDGDTVICKIGVLAAASDLRLEVDSITSGLAVNNAKVWTQHLNGTHISTAWSGFSGAGSTYSVGKLGSSGMSPSDVDDGYIVVEFNVTVSSPSLNKTISLSFEDLDPQESDGVALAGGPGFQKTTLAPELDVIAALSGPTAVITATGTATYGVAKSFSSASSSDADGVIVSYAWNFGDGNTSAAPNPTHTYTSVGVKTVTLTVTDNDGLTDTDTLSVTVTATNPVAVITAPSSAFNNTPVSFSSASSTGSISSYAWDFGDGGTSTSANPTHTYTTAGTYTVTLTLTDPDGDTDTDTHSITINSDLPVAVIGGPTSGYVGYAVGFTSTSSYDPNGSIVSRSWNFGDGGTSSVTNPSHTYAAVGSYTVTLIVTDNDGKTASDTHGITISEISGGGDDDAMRTPWTLYNPATSVGYDWEINPQTFKVTKVKKSINSDPTAAGQRLYYEGRPQPVALSFSGVVLTQAQLQQLYAAADTRNQIMVMDDLGHTYWFYITNLQVSRQLKRYSEWYHTFSVDAIVLDWT